MDILKLNKWKVIIILFFLALFFINRECKKNEEEMLREYIFADMERFLDKEKIKKEIYPNIKDIIEKILSTPDDYSNPQKTMDYLSKIGEPKR